MQTSLPPPLLQTPQGQRADAILRKCVHCGFCTATCPTYQVLGDELDGPRGRIYLIKEMLEGAPVTEKTRSHLDRCLTCRSCESTCPSGVQYGKLVDIGREVIEHRVPRKLSERLLRSLLLAVVPHRRRFAPLLALGRLTRPLLPGRLKAAVPPSRPAGAWPAARHSRRMLVLQGCVQPVALPSVNAAAARVLDRAGISLVATQDGCCGAMAHHLSQSERAREQMRRNIDTWWPAIEAGAEAVVVTASGCGAMVQDYGELLADDPAYAAKAERVSSLFRDLGQVVADAAATLPLRATNAPPVAYHAPCSLQHGLKQRGIVESILARAGCQLTPVADSHLCCGSAGTYSLLQPAMSQELKQRKLTALQAGKPDVILSANVGCMLHLQSGTSTPVRHWIELLDERLA
jgi:glycolate oxidase iron-sulfur subunit